MEPQKIYWDGPHFTILASGLVLLVKENLTILRGSGYSIQSVCGIGYGSPECQKPLSIKALIGCQLRLGCELLALAIPSTPLKLISGKSGKDMINLEKTLKNINI